MARVIELEKHHYADFSKKAEQFFHSLKESIQAGRWDAAGSSAVHCVICSTDALTCYYLKQRSASERHQDAVQLLKKLPLKEIDDKARQFLDVINLKNQVEYSYHLTSEKQALLMAKQAERFYAWAKDQLPR